MAQRHRLQAIAGYVNLDELGQRVVAFAREREWAQFHDPKNLVMALSSEVGELNDVLRWVRNENADAAVRCDPSRTAMIDEIGDLGILLLLLCDRVGVKLDEAVVRKLEINGAKYPVERSKGRPDRPDGELETI